MFLTGILVDWHGWRVDRLRPIKYYVVGAINWLLCNDCTPLSLVLMTDRWWSDLLDMDILYGMTCGLWVPKFLFIRLLYLHSTKASLIDAFYSLTLNHGYNMAPLILLFINPLWFLFSSASEPYTWSSLSQHFTSF